MRNAIAHGYFKVDLEIVWNTIESYLPELYQQVHHVITSIEKIDDTDNTRDKH